MLKVLDASVRFSGGGGDGDYSVVVVMMVVVVFTVMAVVIVLVIAAPAVGLGYLEGHKKDMKNESVVPVGQTTLPAADDDADVLERHRRRVAALALDLVALGLDSLLDLRQEAVHVFVCVCVCVCG